MVFYPSFSMARWRVAGVSTFSRALWQGKYCVTVPNIAGSFRPVYMLLSEIQADGAAA